MDWPHTQQLGNFETGGSGIFINRKDEIMALEDEIMALVQVLNKLRASIKDMFLAKV